MSEITEKMKTYRGTKTLKATLMTRGEYCKYRGWDVPKGENPDEEIYLVEYPVEVDTVPNHPDHEGYISMSPKTVFNNYYRRSKEDSIGKRRVKVGFNPGDYSPATDLKLKTADLIDMIDGQTLVQGNRERARLIALAMTKYEEAAMWAVKAMYTED